VVLPEAACVWREARAWTFEWVGVILTAMPFDRAIERHHAMRRLATEIAATPATIPQLRAADRWWDPAWLRTLGIGGRPEVTARARRRPLRRTARSIASRSVTGNFADPIAPS
jgi:hypothetical protein